MVGALLVELGLRALALGLLLGHGGLALGLLGLALADVGRLAVLGGDRLAPVPELALPLLQFSLAPHARQHHEQGDDDDGHHDDGDDETC